MALSDSIGRVANTAILAGLSLAMIKQIYPNKYEAEKRRRASRKVVKRKPIKSRKITKKKKK